MAGWCGDLFYVCLGRKCIWSEHLCELLPCILDVVVYSSGDPELCGVCVKDSSVCHGDGCQGDIC